MDCEAVPLAVAVAEERRRWKSLHAARRDDGLYYTWEEWLNFFGPEDEDFARGLWERGVAKDADPQREASLRWRLAADVGELPRLPLEALAAGAEGVVLECWQGCGEGAHPGNSLRAGEAGAADLLGGTGLRATLAVEVVKAVPERCLLVRLRCPFLGTYLRAIVGACTGVGGKLDGPGQLDFLGAAAEEDEEASERWGASTTIFEMVLRVAPVPLVSFVAKGGGSMLTFVPRRAPGFGPVATVAPWWRGQLMEQAHARAQMAGFQGRRRHPRDLYRAYYTFPEWVEHVDEEEWGGPFLQGALVLAELVWTTECICEELDDWTHLNSMAVDP